MVIDLPTKRIARAVKTGSAITWKYSTGAQQGPLAVVFVDNEWFVLHTASGGRIGNNCRNGLTAMLFTGALLAMDVDWTRTIPAFSQAECDAAQARIEAAL